MGGGHLSDSDGSASLIAVTTAGQGEAKVEAALEGVEGEAVSELRGAARQRAGQNEQGTVGDERRDEREGRRRGGVAGGGGGGSSRGGSLLLLRCVVPVGHVLKTMGRRSEGMVWSAVHRQRL